MVRGAWCTAPCFRMAIRVRRSWDHPRRASSAAAGHIHWPRRPLPLGRDALALLGRTRNADWVDRKAGRKIRKRRLEDQFDRLAVQQVGSYLGHTGRGANTVTEAALVEWPGGLSPPGSPRTVR